MSNQWQQFDQHDTQQWQLTDAKQAELIEQWRVSESFKPSFDDVIIEAQKLMNIRQGV